MLDLLNRSVITLAAFGGLAMESMTRGHGWRFLDMGRKIERCLHIIGLIRGTLTTVSANEGPLLEALLEIADSSMTFRRRYLSHVASRPGARFALADESNPRSLAYQLGLHQRRRRSTCREQAPHAGRGLEQRLALALLTAMQLADIDRLATISAKNTRPHLEELLVRLEAELPVLSDKITHHFLSHLQTSRHLRPARSRQVLPARNRAPMLYRVNHTTKYHYSEPVTLCHNLVAPDSRARGPRQTLPAFADLWWPLCPVVLVQEVDYFGNATLFFTIQEPHPKLTVTANHLVDITPPAGPTVGQACRGTRRSLRVVQDHSPEGLDAYQYVFNSAYIKTGAELAWNMPRPSFPPGRPLWKACST